MKYNVKDNVIFGAVLGVVFTTYIVVVDRMTGVHNTEIEEKGAQLSKELLHVLTEKKIALEKVNKYDQDKL